ncbi:hypothetical protein FQN57_002913 [Myotisia sp. PD_48]|nr:hypothetical protein FQN57_002913 [Myotisia sp. PD_48]
MREKFKHFKVSIRSLLVSPASSVASTPDPRSDHGFPPDLLSPTTITLSARSSISSLTAVTTHSQSCPVKRGLWQNALEKLSEEEREIINEHTVSGGFEAHGGSPADSLLEGLKEKQKLCDDKAWKFSFNGKIIVLRDVAEKVIVWVDRFKAVGNLVATAEPVTVGLPWAGIQLLLQTATSEYQMMGSLLVGLDKIFYLINRCSIYERLYPYDYSIEKAHENFEAALTRVYTLILSFLATALKIYKQKTLVRTVNAIWSVETINEFSKSFQDSTIQLDIEVQNCERSYNHHDRLLSNEQAVNLKRLLVELESFKELKDSVQAIDTKVENIWHNLHRKEIEEILTWASNIPYIDHHNNLTNGRIDGTGLWFLETQIYQNWRSSPESTIMWLHGIPGAGKSKLVTRVVDNVSEELEERGLAYFYCDKSDTSRRLFENILRSFVKQLSLSENESLHQALIDIYNTKKRKGFASAKLSVDECKQILRGLLLSYEETVLILDGLDECYDDSRAYLLEYFESLVETSTSGLIHTTKGCQVVSDASKVATRRLKILIASRNNGDIQDYLQKWPNFSLEEANSKDDIAAFVKEKISQCSNRRYPISLALQAEISDVLLEKSNGMFQWARLQIEQVLALKTERAIRNRLGRLPVGLKAAYDEIYSNIHNAEPTEKQVAIRALQFVMCASQPPNAKVLAVFACRDPEDEGDHLLPCPGINFILDICQNLLVLDTYGDKENPSLIVCRVAHLSIQEYFEEHRWPLSTCHANAAKVCLSLLNSPVDYQQALSQNPEHKQHLESDRDFYHSERQPVSRCHPTPDFQLIIYATNFWGYHVVGVSAAGVDAHLSRLLMRFFGSVHESGEIYRAWCRMCRYLVLMFNSYVPEQFYAIPELDPNTIPLFAICRLGIYDQLPGIWEPSNIDIGLRNEAGKSLFHLVLLSGNLQLLQKLVEFGADVNEELKDTTYGSALAFVAGGNSQSAVQFLLDLGADVNQQLRHGSYGSALAAAAASTSNSCVSICKLLVGAGADINQQLIVGDYGSALAAAARRTDVEVSQFLLDAGADPNQQLNGFYGSALVAAIFSRCPDQALILIRAGADVNQQLQVECFGSAVDAATAYHKEFHISYNRFFNNYSDDSDDSDDCDSSDNYDNSDKLVREPNVATSGACTVETCKDMGAKNDGLGIDAIHDKSGQGSVLGHDAPPETRGGDIDEDRVFQLALLRAGYRSLFRDDFVQLLLCAGAKINEQFFCGNYRSVIRELVDSEKVLGGFPEKEALIQLLPEVEQDIEKQLHEVSMDDISKYHYPISKETWKFFHS